MGMGATNTLDRVAASIGQLHSVKVQFQESLDVPNAGALLALPALLAVGLLRHTSKYFELPKGFYGLENIFLLLAFMALSRIKTIEDLRYCAPGEWGKILGLDRIPEAKTLRKKVGILAQDNKPAQWSAQLCNDWMAAAPESAATLYIDGHVRVYYGAMTKLPRHYVSRERLCLRATTDYWVNAMDGQPFFLVTQAVDPGMLKVLENEIVPRLKKDVPSQPGKEELDKDKYLSRFTLVFDREGYSPVFMEKMWKDRISCTTYHKYPGENWPEEEFTTHEAPLDHGNTVKVKLAERGTFLGGRIWVREIRKLTGSGHQTSVTSTDYRSNLVSAATKMFSRWSQENFFRYMRQHYNLDRLAEHATEEIPDTVKVVNPDYREIDGKIRSKNAILSRKAAKFGALTYEGEIDPAKVEKYQEEKADIQEEIERLNKDVDELKGQRKSLQKHISISELSEEDRFQRLATQSKHLIDAIKMIAYRAETAMANTLREKTPRYDGGRRLLRTIYSSEADILPDEKNGTLTIRLHHIANRAESEAMNYLCSELNSTETIFPGTNLRLYYELVSFGFSRGQEV